MQTVSTNYTVTDYCSAIDRREIIANQEYQRSDKVWPPAARSFLIETILLGYPIPKIYLCQITDVKSRKTIKEIVDGQQRSKTLHDFFHNKLKISRRSEIKEASGKAYTDLDDTLKEKFLSYRLSVDLFVSATKAEIRETFRRVNSYTVPLNPEEQRHALYQGVFKWFIYDLTRKYEEAFLQMGVFSEKQIVRMADTKLISEFTHAFLNGVTTTKSKDIDRMYEKNDKTFQEEEEIASRFEDAITQLISFNEIHNSPLMRPHVFYSLLIAISQCIQPSENLKEILDTAQPFVIDQQISVTNLSVLAQALEEESTDSKYSDFKSACSEKTNVIGQRKTRICWLGKALLPQLL